MPLAVSQYKYMLNYPPLRLMSVFLLFSCCLIVLTGIWWWWVENEVEQQHQEYAQHLVRRDELKNRIETQRIILTKRSLIEGVRRKLNSHIKQADLMGEVQTLATSTNVRVLENRALDKKGETGSLYTISTEGTYKDLRNFLSNLVSKSSALILIQHISITRTQQAGLLNAQVEFSARTGEGA